MPNELTPAEQAAADRLPILVSLRGDASAEAARAEVAAVALDEWEDSCAQNRDEMGTE